MKRRLILDKDSERRRSNHHVICYTIKNMCAIHTFVMMDDEARRSFVDETIFN